MPESRKIRQVIRENDKVSTLVFDYSIGAKPGQFVEISGKSFKKMKGNVAMDDGKEMWVVLRDVKCAKDDEVEIAGPMGDALEFGKDEKLLLVADVNSLATMYFVAIEASSIGCEVEFLLGISSEKELFYMQKILSLARVSLRVVTEDGSFGEKGFLEDALSATLDEKKFDRVIKI